jgi:hypothetical protein
MSREPYPAEGCLLPRPLLSTNPIENLDPTVGIA